MDPMYVGRCVSFCTCVFRLCASIYLGRCRRLDRAEDMSGRLIQQVGKSGIGIGQNGGRMVNTVAST